MVGIIFSNRILAIEEAIPYLQGKASFSSVRKQTVIKTFISTRQGELNFEWSIGQFKMPVGGVDGFPKVVFWTGRPSKVGTSVGLLNICTRIGFIKPIILLGKQ